MSKDNVWDFLGARTKTDAYCSYEGLPPNFSLVQNMAAGAFAGIAVRTTATYIASESEADKQ